jgi:hypothetical protein
MDVTTMSIKAMKEELVSMGGSADGCLERAEVVSRLLEVRDAESRKREPAPANNKRARDEDVVVIQDDNDADVPAANRRQRTTAVDDIHKRIMQCMNWQDLFEVDSSVPTDEAQEMHARAIRNRLFRASHPDRAVQDEESQKRAHQATVRINQLWDQASSFFAAPVHAAVDHSNQPGNGGAVSSTLLVSRFLAPPDLTNEPHGSLEMLAKACHLQPPTMLQMPLLDAYTGFGSFDTLISCRFLPMSTNRCVSQDVVAQRGTHFTCFTGTKVQILTQKAQAQFVKTFVAYVSVAPIITSVRLPASQFARRLRNSMWWTTGGRDLRDFTFSTGSTACAQWRSSRENALIFQFGSS